MATKAPKSQAAGESPSPTPPTSRIAESGSTPEPEDLFPEIPGLLQTTVRQKYGDYEYKPAHDRWCLNPELLQQALPVLQELNAQRYFITSGDAVTKVRILVRDCRALKTQAGDEGAELVQRLLDKLIELRGSAIFMETEWKEHRLLIIAKNPRPREI